MPLLTVRYVKARCSPQCLTDRRLSLLIGTGQGSTRLPFQRGDRAQGGRYLEDRLDDLFHTPSADVMTAAQVRHHCGQAWPDDMGANLRGDLATIEVATARTGACVSLVFGDVGRQLREFGNLMPGRLGVTGRGFRGQGSLAVGAGRGHLRHDLVDPLGREAMAMVSRMPRLSAWLTSGRCLDDRFGSPRWIDRRGRGGVR